MTPREALLQGIPSYESLTATGGNPQQRPRWGRFSLPATRLVVEG